MFNNNQLLNEINDITTTNDLFSFISRRSKYVLSILNDLLKKINSLKGTLLYDSSIFNLLYFNQKELNGYEYFILEAYTNAIEDHMVPFNSFYTDTRNLYFLLCDIRLIDLLNDWPMSSSVENDTRSSALNAWNNWQKSFMHDIFDMYIPSDSPTSIIDDMIDKGYGIAAAIHDDDSSLLKKMGFAQGDSLKLQRYLYDIYHNYESKQNAFVDMHGLYVITYSFIHKVNATVDRFSKYLISSVETSDDLMNDVYQLFYTFSSDIPINLLSEELYTVLEKYVKSGICNIKVLNLFLNEVLTDAYDLIDTYHYDLYYRTINEIVTNYNVNTEVEVTENSVTESMTYIPDDGFEYVIEQYKKNSVQIHDNGAKLYKAYKNYKNNQDKIDSQLSKAVQWGKKLLIGDVKTEVIEGKKFSAMSLLKTALSTAAIFSVSWIAGLIAIVVKYSLKKSTTISERKKIVMELEAEIEMINEKIEDARGDGDREAKYAMMRTRTELQNALKRIKYGMEADERSVNTAKSTIKSIRSGVKL